MAGGYNNESTNFLTSAEIYDPNTGTWTPTGYWTPEGLWVTTYLNKGRDFHAATLLPNGQVLVVGGEAAYYSAELYDPTKGTWTNTGSPHIRLPEGCIATLLRNGKVLVSGFYDGAELYDPATGTWRLTGSANHQCAGPATLLPNGMVLFAGVSGHSSEIYDPVKEIWSTSASLNIARDGAMVVLLGNGKVLIAGGLNGSTILKSAELYGPAPAQYIASIFQLLLGN